MANKEKAKAELVELDVREVSIVDQPANKRRFLIVKRRDGSAIEPTEDEEMRRAIPASERDSRPGVVRDTPRAVQKVEEEEDVSILDLFGGDEDEGDPTNDDQGDDDRATEGDPEPTEVVTKKTIEALRGAVSSWLGGLNAAAATLKEIGDGEAPADLMAKLQSAAVGMASLVGEEVSKFAESAKAAKVFEAVTTAVGALSKAAAALKGEEPAAEVVDLIKSAAKALAVEPEDEQEEATTDPPPAPEPKPQPAKVEKAKTEIFVSHREDGNHHVIIKRGAKMRKTNLAKLRNAVRMLSELLKEVGGSEEEKRVETTKQIEEVVKTTVDQATSKLAETFNAKLEEITKALQGAEVPTSQSEGEDENTTPPTEIQKGRNLWGSFFKGLTH